MSSNCDTKHSNLAFKVFFKKWNTLIFNAKLQKSLTRVQGIVSVWCDANRYGFKSNVNVKIIVKKLLINLLNLCNYFKLLFLAFLFNLWLSFAILDLLVKMALVIFNLYYRGGPWFFKYLFSYCIKRCLQFNSSWESFYSLFTTHFELMKIPVIQNLFILHYQFHQIFCYIISIFN